MKKQILSWLLYHANKSKDKKFYSIKNRILNEYGVKIDVEVQYISGKKCFSCRCTGDHVYYSLEGYEYDRDACWNCNGSGWYKKPVWNWLDVIQLGKYKFHQPFSRSYNEPTEAVRVINGYVEHNNTRYTEFALFLLFLLYEKGYIKRWYRETGKGWRAYWWKPRNWMGNIIHIIKYGRNSYPLRRKISSDDLPF